MHLTNSHWHHSSQNKAYLSNYPNKKNQTYKRKPSIHLTCENPIMHLNKATTPNMAASIESNNTYQKQNINKLETLTIHLKTLTQMHEHC